MKYYLLLTANLVACLVVVAFFFACAITVALSGLWYPCAMALCGGVILLSITLYGGISEIKENE